MTNRDAPRAVAAVDAVTVVRCYYRLIDAGDVSGVIDLFAPDATYRRPGYPPMRGRAALATFYRSVRVVAAGRHEIRIEVAADDRVAIAGIFRGTLTDGSAAVHEFADFFTVHDGSIVDRQTYFDAPAI